MKKFYRKNRKIHIGKAQRPDLKLMGCDKGPGYQKKQITRCLKNYGVDTIYAHWTY